MTKILMKLAYATVLLFLLWLVSFDTYRLHINKDRITLKLRQVASQHDWHLFYKQDYVYYASSFRYENDLVELSKVLPPYSTVLSDIITSYYLAANLPLYVRNVQRHHGLYYFKPLEELMRTDSLCYINHPGHMFKTKKLLKDSIKYSKRNGWQSMEYLIINKDTLNPTLKKQCLSVRGVALAPLLAELAELVFDGEYFRLYKLHQ